MRPIARPPGSAVSETASTNQKWPKHRLLRPLLLAPRPTLQNRLTTPPCGRPGTHAPSVGAVRLNLGGQRGEKTWNFKALVKLCQTPRTLVAWCRTVALALRRKACRRAGTRLAAATQPTSRRARATRVTTTAPLMRPAPPWAPATLANGRPATGGRPLAAPAVTGGAARESWVDSRSRRRVPVGGRMRRPGASGQSPAQPCAPRSAPRVTTKLALVALPASVRIPRGSRAGRCARIRWSARP